MLLDLDNKTVTFGVEETLTLDQLYALVDLLDDEEDEPVDVDDEIARAIKALNAENDLNRILIETENDIDDTVSEIARFWRTWIGEHALDKAVRRIFKVESDTTDKIYSVVAFNDGSWACSCPDWIHRQSHIPGSMCKHAWRLCWS